MKYTFDSRIAEMVGVNAAIIFENLAYWIRKNIANEVHTYDGNVWTYNSRKAFEELFPFFTTSQIRTALDKLVESNLIVTGNYNKAKIDRTKWYALTPEGRSLANIVIGEHLVTNSQCNGDQSPMHLSKIANGFAKNRKPIPNNKPNINNREKEINKEKEAQTEQRKSETEEIITHLNAKADTNYRAKSKKTQSLINARLNEGFTVDDFKRVIDNKVAEWKNDKRMCVYLRPETLFGSKFEGYLNQNQTSKAETSFGATFGYEVEAW